MSKQKFALRSWKNKYTLFFCSFILFVSILTPVSAHYLANNQPLISQNNTSKQAPRQNRKKLYGRPPTVTPIKTPTTAKTRRGTGSCEKADSQINLTILAPKSYPGLMTSENPTLTWYVPDSKPYPIEIFVHRYGERDPFYSTSIGEIQSKEGINEYTLPKSIKLSPNQIYTWKVKIYCRATDTSQSYQDESNFRLIEIPSDLKMQIKASNDLLENTKLYAYNYIWYDAFMQTLQAHDDKLKREYQQLLLNDLAEGEDDTYKEFRQQLQKITEKMNF